MMRLGRLLVEAYRRYDDTDRPTLAIKQDIHRVHVQIVTHRESCEVCKETASRKALALIA